MADRPPSRLRERVQAGDAPPPGTRVVVARIFGEAQSQDASRVASALVGLRGEITEYGSLTALDPQAAAAVKLDGSGSRVHFGWDELELEENYEEGSDARSSGNG